MTTDRTEADEWVEMKLRGLLVDPNTEAPVVVLREAGGSLYLPIWIGVFEANAIAVAVEGIRTRRPMTHDLLRSTLESLGATLERIEIHSLIDATFYARLRLRTGSGEEVLVDSRPSDALALALRTGCPVWAARAVLDEAVSTSQASEVADEEKLREWLEKVRPEDLGKYSM